MLTPSRHLLQIAVALLSLIASRVAEASWPHDPAVNVPVCTAAGSQDGPAIARGEDGGIFVAWEDTRLGYSQIYAQHFSAVGTPLWPHNGVLICAIGGIGFIPPERHVHVVSDGAGGAIVAWYDYRPGAWGIYAQRLDGVGNPQWVTDGVAVVVGSAGSQFDMVSDGYGGVTLVWADTRDFATTGEDIYATRVSSSGTVGNGSSNAVPLCVAPGNQYSARIAATGYFPSTAIVTWQDTRTDPNSFDIYAQQFDMVGFGAYWTPDGVRLCTDPANQLAPRIVADETGGAIVVWSDYRTPVNSGDLYAQRLDFGGNLLWGVSGTAVCVKPTAQFFDGLVSDGGGGAFFHWGEQETGLFAQRLDGSGAQQWAAPGIALGSGGGGAPVSDGAGGSIVAFSVRRLNTEYDVFAQRVSANGTLMWGPNGSAVSSLREYQAQPVAVPDGSSGLIAAFLDSRGASPNLYAQRVEAHGVPGNPEPVIASARDVPNDQGGKLKLSWVASTLDLPPLYLVSEYWVWRSAPPNVLARSLDGAGVVTTSAEEAAGLPGALYVTYDGSTTYYWEYVGSQIAGHLAGYSYLVPTTGDSLAGSNPVTAFMVQARQAGGTSWWNSPPDSGYSVDNLSPLSPSPFTGLYAAGATTMQWGANHEADVVSYRLYRGAGASFVTGSTTLVVEQPSTAYVDAAGRPYDYKLTAVDAHGNESATTLLLSNATVEVPNAGDSHALALAVPAPSPSRAGSAFRFSLSRGGSVTLALFDQQGRRVRTLAAGIHAEGEHVLRWDGNDESGRMAPSGLYFLRLKAEGRTLTQRLITLR